MAAEATKVTGGCLCGTVRYEAEVYLQGGWFCHCRMCQKTSGAPAEIAVAVKPGTLRFTATPPKFYRSSGFAERGFCPRCGARIIYRPISEKFAEYTNLAVGCLDHPEDVVPVKHIFVETQLSWYRYDDGVERVRSDEMPEFALLQASAEDLRLPLRKQLRKNNRKAKPTSRRGLSAKRAKNIVGAMKRERGKSRPKK